MYQNNFITFSNFARNPPSVLAQVLWREYPGPWRVLVDHTGMREWEEVGAFAVRALLNAGLGRQLPRVGVVLSRA